MNDREKKQLANLYIQKGELITEIEAMDRQLQIVNRQINQLRNILTQQPESEKKPELDKKRKSNKEKNN